MPFGQVSSVHGGFTTGNSATLACIQYEISARRLRRPSLRGGPPKTRAAQKSAGQELREAATSVVPGAAGGYEG